MSMFHGSSSFIVIAKVGFAMSIKIMTNYNAINSFCRKVGVILPSISVVTPLGLSAEAA